jgi:1-acyl-sn-glycerol-3-phosphate acyltransferase
VVYALVWTLCSTVLRVFFGLRTYGRSNVPRTGGLVLAVNHQSFLDPVVVGCGLTRPVHYMGRDTLFRGGLGALIRALNSFPVKRGGADRGAVKEFIRRVRLGHPVMLFAEGTRTHDGRLGVIMPGAGGIAVRAGAPVVPTYIDGAFDAWPRHRKLPEMARLSITYGRPIPVERLPDETKREQQQRVRAEIEKRLRALEVRAFAAKRRHGRAALAAGEVAA